MPVSGASGPGDQRPLVAVAEAMLSKAPELALVFARRALALTGPGDDATGSPRGSHTPDPGAAADPITAAARAVEVSALVRLGRHADAVEPAIGVLLGGALTEGASARVRTELAGCAGRSGAQRIALTLLRPVLDAEQPPSLRADALVQYAGCLAGLDRRRGVEGLLAEADRLLAADQGLDPDTRRVRRALVCVQTAADQRYHGETRSALAAAREGLALLDRLTDPCVDGGLARPLLVGEIVLALLDDGDRAAAVELAATLTGAPVRATSAMAVGMVMLAIATRVHLPDGRTDAGRALLAEAVRLGRRHGAQSLLAEALTTLAGIDEQQGLLAEALDSLRAARAAETTHRLAVERARTLLANTFGIGEALPAEPHATTERVPAPRREAPRLDARPEPLPDQRPEPDPRPTRRAGAETLPDQRSEPGSLPGGRAGSESLSGQRTGSDSPSDRQVGAGSLSDQRSRSEPLPEWRPGVESTSGRRSQPEPVPERRLGTESLSDGHSGTEPVSERHRQPEAADLPDRLAEQGAGSAGESQRPAAKPTYQELRQSTMDALLALTSETPRWPFAEDEAASAARQERDAADDEPPPGARSARDLLAERRIDVGGGGRRRAEEPAGSIPQPPEPPEYPTVPEPDEYPTPEPDDPPERPGKRRKPEDPDVPAPPSDWRQAAATLSSGRRHRSDDDPAPPSSGGSHRQDRDGEQIYVQGRATDDRPGSGSSFGERPGLGGAAASPSAEPGARVRAGDASPAREGLGLAGSSGGRRRKPDREPTGGKRRKPDTDDDPVYGPMPRPPDLPGHHRSARLPDEEPPPPVRPAAEHHRSAWLSDDVAPPALVRPAGHHRSARPSDDLAPPPAPVQLGEHHRSTRLSDDASLPAGPTADHHRSARLAEDPPPPVSAGGEHRPARLADDVPPPSPPAPPAVEEVRSDAGLAELLAEALVAYQSGQAEESGRHRSPDWTPLDADGTHG